MFVSCQTSFGDKYKKGNLEVYFDKGTKPFAEPIANYFHDNNLVGGTKQSIMLTSTSMGDSEESQHFILKMIQTESNKKFDENELKQVELLEEDLEKSIFNSELEIVLCTSNFLEIQ